MATGTIRMCVRIGCSHCCKLLWRSDDGHGWERWQKSPEKIWFWNRKLFTAIDTKGSYRVSGGTHIVQHYCDMVRHIRSCGKKSMRKISIFPLIHLKWLRKAEEMSIAGMNSNKLPALSDVYRDRRQIVCMRQNKKNENKSHSHTTYSRKAERRFSVCRIQLKTRNERRTDEWKTSGIFLFLWRRRRRSLIISFCRIDANRLLKP